MLTKKDMISFTKRLDLMNYLLIRKTSITTGNNIKDNIALLLNFGFDYKEIALLLNITQNLSAVYCSQARRKNENWIKNRIWRIHRNR